MNYLTARAMFLASCGRLTPQERERAIELFDQTLVAHQARLADAWTAFWEAVFPWRKR